MVSRNSENSTVQRAASISQAQTTLLLRGGEVAIALGISRALAFRWMAEGVLPTVRIAGARTVRVPKKALDAWIEANTRSGS